MIEMDILYVIGLVVFVALAYCLSCLRYKHKQRRLFVENAKKNDNSTVCFQERKGSWLTEKLPRKNKLWCYYSYKVCDKMYKKRVTVFSRGVLKYGYPYAAIIYYDPLNPYRCEWERAQDKESSL